MYFTIDKNIKSIYFECVQKLFEHIRNNFHVYVPIFLCVEADKLGITVE